jgi:predicted 2-oxoglutarate/Fe(II)-dependent dioxygenase YbiX
MFAGASLGAHKDDPKVQTHVCGIYLNDDYDGGELLFPTLKSEVKPKSGSLLFFRGDHNSHAVKKVESGVRCNVLLYFVESSSN